MDIARQIVLGTLVAGIAACSYPDFTYGTSGTSGTSGTIVPSGSAPTCQVTHAGGGSCEYTPDAVCGCSGADKCSVIDEATGRSACTRAGPTMAHAKCGTDSDCVAGTFCEPLTGACATICQNLNDCAPGAQCIPARSAVGAAIPGLKICTAYCELVSAAPCGSNLTCVYDPGVTEFDCVSSVRLQEEEDCQISADCDKGLICVQRSSGNTSTCQPWCHTTKTSPGSTCVAPKPKCVLLNFAVDYNGVQYGFCSSK